jgi:hypothetical protein
MIKAFFGDEKYTTEELNARLKFFIGIILGLTLFGIVFVVLYSLIFVTQPMNGMSPVDNKFFELIIPVATFLTGTLSGIMLAGDDKELRAKAIDAAGKSAPPSAPIAPATFPTKPFVPMAASLPQTSPSGSSNIAGSAAPEVVAGFNGKPAPAQPPQPEI